MIVSSISGLSLTDFEKRKLVVHHLITGIILFSYNIESIRQISSLTQEIKSLRPDIAIFIDQEGGGVQRLKEPLCRKLPEMFSLHKAYLKDQGFALKCAKTLGEFIVVCLAKYGIDTSFAPVLDIESGKSPVMRGRCFGTSPATVIPLVQSFIEGMHQAGSLAICKHFPGHGFSEQDSHFAMSVDNRSFEEIANSDMLIYQDLARKSLVDAVMLAHVCFPQFDNQPASTSKKWIDRLRAIPGFAGTIFSDDLLMKGICPQADEAHLQIAIDRSLQAGCDCLIICNQVELSLFAADYLESKNFKPYSLQAFQNTSDASLQGERYHFLLPQLEARLSKLENFQD